MNTHPKEIEALREMIMVSLIRLRVLVPDAYSEIQMMMSAIFNDKGDFYEHDDLNLH